MGKIYESSDEVKDFVVNIVKSIGLDLVASFKVLSVDKQKKLIRVTKASATTEYFAKVNDCVVCYVNEELFFMLDEEMREILIRDALNGVYYDSEKEKLCILQPDINIFAGTYEKYGEKLVKASECVVLALKQIEEARKKK